METPTPTAIPASRKKAGKQKQPAMFYNPNATEEARSSAVQYTSDRRRLKTSSSMFPTLPPSSDGPPVFEPQEDLAAAAYADSLNEFSYLLGTSVESEPPSTTEDGIIIVKKVRNLNSDNPMLAWTAFREDYLNELVRLDAHKSAPCSQCSVASRTIIGQADYRCRDAVCVQLGAICADYCVDSHNMHPLHWIEKWNGTFFESCTLQELGVTIQLGHPAGQRCGLPQVTASSFTIVDCNGVHDVSLLFCGCSDTPEIRLQLLQASLWPSTPLQPRTATTFGLLRLFHNLSTLGKLPAYDLWKSLEVMTVNETGKKPQDCYRILLRSIRQWRYIKMVKCAGRVHDPSGIPGTNDGELAIQCPACPHPGINLPDGWETRDKIYLNRLFLAVDANFRARNALVSTPERDPSLADGKAYFIPHTPYKAHISSFVNEDDLSSCSGFKAMFLANLKNVKGLRTSGIAGVTCARHGIWRSNGMGDLQRGERYCNIDPLVSVSLINAGLLQVILSYDIVCQYGPNFWDRVAALPSNIRVRVDKDRVVFVIPKFHLGGHVTLNHAQYSFNFLLGVGRTHGETIEENWSHSNRAASQTKMMGPGSREDTLNDIFGFHNWRTIMAFGRVLKTRLAEALKEARTHIEEFNNFNAGMMLFSGPAILESWQVEVVAWEADQSLPCPYEAQLQRKETMREVELQLAREEHEMMMRTSGIIHQSSMSQFLSTALDIEEKQRALAWEVQARRQGTTYQELNIQKQCTTLANQIQKWRGLQQVVMPNIREFLTPDQLLHIDKPGDFVAEANKLFLPSELRASDRALPRACSHSLVDAETRLRMAECRDSLERLRQNLRTRSASHQFSVRNITGQNPITRAEGILRKVQVAIHVNRLRYRWARNALLRLKGHGDWERELRVLKDEDVRGITERAMSEEEAAAQAALQQHGVLNEFMTASSSPTTFSSIASGGEGRRKLSWIWYSYPDPLESDIDVAARNTEPVIQEALKIEWCKARARKMRWEEEIYLLVEEMERVVKFFRWKAAWWRSRPMRDIEGDDILKIGLAAYAEASASRMDAKADEFQQEWSALLNAGKEFIAGAPASRIITVELDEELQDDDYEDIDT